MILRRGIPYGPKWTENETGRHRRGLLFMCYQRDLENQFEYMQKRLMGYLSYSTNKGPHREMIDIVRRGYKLGMERWITTKGGEYFFSPSISVLRDLGKYAIQGN